MRRVCCSTCRKLWDSPPPWDPDPRKSELALWVRARSGDLGVCLTPDDAAYVAAATGNDLAASTPSWSS